MLSCCSRHLCFLTTQWVTSWGFPNLSPLFEILSHHHILPLTGHPHFFIYWGNQDYQTKAVSFLTSNSFSLLIVSFPLRSREMYLSSWPNINLLLSVQGQGLWWECVSAFPTYLDEGIFSLVQCIGVVQVVSGFLSEAVFPCAAVDSVYPREEVSSKASYVTIWTLQTSLHSIPTNWLYKLCFSIFNFLYSSLQAIWKTPFLMRSQVFLTRVKNLYVVFPTLQQSWSISQGPAKPQSITLLLKKVREGTPGSQNP